MAVSLIFTGCGSNQKLSGTYDADTFRALYDPVPGVDYSAVLAKAEARENRKLNLPSGTYDADTFRAKYYPDPEVDYSSGKTKRSHRNSSSNINMNDVFAVVGALMAGMSAGLSESGYGIDSYGGSSNRQVGTQSNLGTSTRTEGYQDGWKVYEKPQAGHIYSSREISPYGSGGGRSVGSGGALSVGSGGGLSVGSGGALSVGSGGGRSIVNPWQVAD